MISTWCSSLIYHRKSYYLQTIVSSKYLGFGHLPELWSGGRGLPPVRHRPFLFLAAIGSVCFLASLVAVTMFRATRWGFPRCRRNKIYAFIKFALVIIKYSPVFHCCFFSSLVSVREFQSCKIILDIKGFPLVISASPFKTSR